MSQQERYKKKINNLEAMTNSSNEHESLVAVKMLERKKSEIVIKKKHTIKHSKDNALEEFEKVELFRAIRKLDMTEDLKYKYEVLVHLMMNGGLRISEALQVRLEWFNETEDGIILRIPNKARDLGNMKRDWKPKTLAGKREIIFIDPAVGEKVKSYFIQNKGIGMLRQRAYQIMRMLGKMIDKPNLHPHALRSTYANTLVYAGVNATTLMYCLGWSDLNVALNYIKANNMAARKDLLEKMRGQ
ncbi:MAG: tyrosine-type recombinase/integrase [Spirochaetota bacterium]|nr:tyrosine-type recombinase/integrase [Spirochaetota bacterium]